jgi:hypothetical protein
MRESHAAPEIGVAIMRPKDAPVGLGDSRIFHRATSWAAF